MKNKEYYILLNRFTNFKINKEDIEDYLEECKEFNENPTPLNFLEHIGSDFSFNDFLEEIEDTDIEDDTQFYKLIKKIREND